MKCLYFNIVRCKLVNKVNSIGVKELDTVLWKGAKVNILTKQIVIFWIYWTLKEVLG